jgi:hypothetical protein
MTEQQQQYNEEFIDAVFILMNESNKLPVHERQAKKSEHMDLMRQLFVDHSMSTDVKTTHAVFNSPQLQAKILLARQGKPVPVFSSVNK